LNLVSLHRGHDQPGSFDEGHAGGLPTQVCEMMPSSMPGARLQP
jgi:hypothetical protein